MADALSECSFDVWYPRLRRVSIKSEIIRLPAGFVAYLLEDGDGIFLPPRAIETKASSSSGWSEDEDDADAPEQQRAFGFEVEPLFAQIDESILRLGGAVFPKMNWSSPRDAAWVLGGSTRCVSARDVVTLLKCSQHISHDLVVHSSAFGADTCAALPDGKWVLALRRWSNLHPAGEFRCFAHSGHLIAVSQRDRFTHFAHLAAEREDLVAQLRAFWQSTLLPDPVFGAAGRPCALDVYVDSARRVHVLDVSSFDESRTDPLLFTWDELVTLGAHAASGVAPASFEVRLVEAGGAHFGPSPKLYSGVPLELQPTGPGPAVGRADDADTSEAIELVRSALRLE